MSSSSNESKADLTEEDEDYLARCSDTGIRLVPKAPADEELNNHELILYLDANQDLRYAFKDGFKIIRKKVMEEEKVIFSTRTLTLPKEDIEVLKQLFKKPLPRKIDSLKNDINLTERENDVFGAIYRRTDKVLLSKPLIYSQVSKVFNYLINNDRMLPIPNAVLPTKSVFNYLLKCYLFNSKMKSSFAAPLLNYFLKDATPFPYPDHLLLATSENFQLLCCTASLRPDALEKVFQQLKESKSLTQERFDEVMNAQFDTPFAVMHWLKKTAPALAFDEFAHIPITELRKLKKENRLTVEACREVYHLTSGKIHEAVPVFPIDISKLTAAYTTVSPSNKVKKEEVPDEEENKKNKPS